MVNCVGDGALLVRIPCVENKAKINKSVSRQVQL